MTKYKLESDQRKRELLKPIEVFNVPEALRDRAIQLRKDLSKLDDEFQNVRCELTPEGVDTKLSEWVDKLLSKLKEGQSLAERRRQIESELDGLAPDLSPKAQRLRNELANTGDFTELVVTLLNNRNFNSTSRGFGISRRALSSQLSQLNDQLNGSRKMNWLAYHKHLSLLAEATETLTPSQASTQDTILKAVRRREGNINLWGNPGVGKTFLAHYLHHRADLVYFSSPTCYDRQVSSNSVIAIDNAPHTRQAARRLYDDIRWTGKDYSAVANVILITRQPIEDAVHRIALTLTNTDITYMNKLLLQQFGDFALEEGNLYLQQSSGLWGHVKALAQREQ